MASGGSSRASPPVSDTECAQAPTDFGRIGRVAVGAEDRVGQNARPLLPLMRVDVFPHDLACWCDFEYPPPLALADQRMARAEALRTANVRAEERPRRGALVLPHRLTCAGIKLDHPRERILARVVPIGEEGQVSVGEHRAVMLHTPGVVALLPARLARGAIDDHDGGEPPETEHDVPIGQRATCI